MKKKFLALTLALALALPVLARADHDDGGNEGQESTTFAVTSVSPSTVENYQANEITITGTGFSSIARVEARLGEWEDNAKDDTDDTVALTNVTVVNDTTITATVPAGAEAEDNEDVTVFDDGVTPNTYFTLDNALTSYDVGIKLPEAVQPNYHVARLLNEAPVGLILLLVLLVVPSIIVGRPVALTVIGLTTAAYYLLYTFMGQFADICPSFDASFLVSVAVLTTVVALLRLRDASSRVLAWQDTAAFFALAFLYPLAVIDADRTAFWMQAFYVAVLLYVCVLVFRFRVLPALAEKEAGSHE